MIPITRPQLPPLEEYVSLLGQIWDSRMLSNFGEFAQQFADEARDYLNVPYALPLTSCDLGLILTLKALELPAGSPCFISDFTFNSTINAAIWAGMTPVLVDIDADSYNMSPDALRSEMDDNSQPGV